MYRLNYRYTIGILTMHRERQSVTYNQYLSCRYFANNNLLAPKYEHVQLTNEQKQKIHEFVKPIFLNSFMYINRLTDPNTYSDNAYVVQLRINGLLYFETFGLSDIPYFTEFIRYIIGITSSKGLRIEMD